MRKTILILFASVVMLLGLAGVAESFTCALDNPGAAGRLDGTENINISFDGMGTNGSGGPPNATIRAAFFCRSNSTANSSFTLVFNTTNTTVQSNESTGEGSVNFTTNMSRFYEDATNYECFATCYNGTTGTIITDTATASTLGGIEIDYTVPVAPTTLTPGAGVLQEVKKGKTQHLKGTVNDPTTTACSFIINFGTFAGNYSSQATGVGTICTVDLNQINIPQGTYTWTLQASDGRNVTSSSVTGSVFKYDGDIPLSGAAGQAFLNAQKNAEGAKFGNFLTQPTHAKVPIPLGVTIVIVIALLYMWNQRK